jgi:hypothetical protein
VTSLTSDSYNKLSYYWTHRYDKVDCDDSGGWEGIEQGESENIVPPIH